MTAPAPASASSAAPVKVTVTESPGTEYFVLKKKDDGWIGVGKSTARTTEAAIKAKVEKLAESDQPGMYVAVVASRWQPMDIEAKVERSLIVTAVKT